MSDVSREEKLEQLERIMHSRTLHNSPSLKAFLHFVTTKAIDNQESQFKEYVIAAEFFGRGDDYDSRIDSIVRVQASRLRARLHEYYATEGRGDKVLINLPKGHYAPVFTHLLNDVSETHNSDIKKLATEETERADLLNQAAPLWGEMLRAPNPVQVVFSNTIFHGTYLDGMKLYNGLEKAENGTQELAYSAALSTYSNHPPMIDHYTGIGELMGVFFLSEFFAKAGHSMRVKRSLMLTWDDMKTENIVVIGSPAENLFLNDLPQKQDFVFRPMKDSSPDWLAIFNTNPGNGEHDCYRAKQIGPSPSQISEDYAVISMLKGLGEDNRLMILAGINTFGTQAAVEYVTSPKYIKDLINHLNVSPEGEPPHLPDYFQLLLKAKVNGGVPVQISYVTHHVLDQ